MNRELPAWRRTAPETDTNKLFNKDALMQSLQRERQQLKEAQEAPPAPDAQMENLKEGNEQSRKREKLHSTLLDQLNKHQLILGKDDETRLKSALQYANPEDLRRFYDTDSQSEENGVISQILERIPQDSMRSEMIEQSLDAKTEKGRDTLVKTLMNLDIDLKSSLAIVDQLGADELQALAEMPKVQVELLAGVYESMYSDTQDSQQETDDAAQQTRKAG